MSGGPHRKRYYLTLALRPMVVKNSLLLWAFGNFVGLETYLFCFRESCCQIFINSSFIKLKFFSLRVLVPTRNMSIGSFLMQIKINLIGRNACHVVN